MVEPERGLSLSAVFGSHPNWFVSYQFMALSLMMWWSQLILMSHMKSMINWKIIWCLRKQIKFTKALIIHLDIDLHFSVWHDTLSVKNKN